MCQIVKRLQQLAAEKRAEGESGSEGIHALAWLLAGTAPGSQRDQLAEELQNRFVLEPVDAPAPRQIG